jgi:hypothetical protein
LQQTRKDQRKLRQKRNPKDKMSHVRSIRKTGSKAGKAC